jgi:hypothetical protein
MWVRLGTSWIGAHVPTMGLNDAPMPEYNLQINSKFVTFFLVFFSTFLSFPSLSLPLLSFLLLLFPTFYPSLFF